MRTVDLVVKAPAQLLLMFHSVGQRAVKACLELDREGPVAR